MRLMNDDFSLFRLRFAQPDTPFKEEVIGRVMQIFLYDLWTVYSSEMSQMETNDNAARIFLRFLSLVQKDCRQQRDVAYYADLLCITPKYLSQVSRSVSGSSCLGVDHVLRHLRTRLAAQRPVEDTDRGGRPDALRNGLPFLPLREEIAGEIAVGVPKQTRVNVKEK